MAYDFKTVFPPSLPSEILILTKKSLEIGWGEGRSRTREYSDSKQAAVRVIDEGREALVTLSSDQLSDLKRALSHALSLAQNSPAEPHRSLPSPGVALWAPSRQSAISPESIKDKKDRLADLEKKMLAVDRRLKKVVRLNWNEEKEETYLENSLGVSIHQSQRSETVLIEALAEDKGETQSAWDFRCRGRIDSAEFESMAMSVAQHAVDSLGAKPLTSGDYAVVFHPSVVSQLMGLFSEALSSESVQLGKSFLRGMMNRSIASDLVTFEDNPHLDGGVASAAFDDEGSPTEQIILVKNGVLSDFFYDSRTASKAQRKTNGHGYKESLGQSPKPGASNFSLRPGSVKTADMLLSEPSLFYVWDVMGMHMADPITGEFSLGASGFFYQKGKRQQAVRGVTLAGTILDLLKKIKSVGPDLTWYGDRGAPHILVSPMAIAGS